MIEIEYSINQNLLQFHSIGHANYDKSGHDIVCSAVSSVIIGALNAIKDIDRFNTKIEKGDVEIISTAKMSNHDSIVIETMLYQLMTIESEFENYVKIKRRDKNEIKI